MQKKKINFQKDNNLQEENDSASLIIEKDFFSHKYVQDYGDDTNYEVFFKNVIQAGFSVFPVGEFEFEGSVIYEDYIWDINLNYKNYLHEYYENNLISASCDDIIMKKGSYKNLNYFYKPSDGDEVCFFVSENKSRKLHYIIRSDETVAATINERNNTFTFDTSMTEEEKCDVIKSIALFKCYKHYIWNDMF